MLGIIPSPSQHLHRDDPQRFWRAIDCLSARLVAQTELDASKAQGIGGHAPGAGRLSLTSSPVSILSRRAEHRLAMCYTHLALKTALLESFDVSFD